MKKKINFSVTPAGAPSSSVGFGHITTTPGMEYLHTHIPSLSAHGPRAGPDDDAVCFAVLEVASGGYSSMNKAHSSCSTTVVRSSVSNDDVCHRTPF